LGFGGTRKSVFGKMSGSPNVMGENQPLLHDIPTEEGFYFELYL
jgi:hypothetical protein